MSAHDLFRALALTAQTNGRIVDVGCRVQAVDVSFVPVIAACRQLPLKADNERTRLPLFTLEHLGNVHGSLFATCHRPYHQGGPVGGITCHEDIFCEFRLSRFEESHG